MKDIAKKGAHAHTDINVFHAIIAILEGGCLYTRGSDKAAQKIISICKVQGQRCLREYDAALTRIEGEA